MPLPFPALLGGGCGNCCGSGGEAASVEEDSGEEIVVAAMGLVAEPASVGTIEGLTCSLLTTCHVLTVDPSLNSRILKTNCRNCYHC